MEEKTHPRGTLPTSGFAPPDSARAYTQFDQQALTQAEAGVASVWQEGDAILDIYDVIGLLGEGGMGKVYRVHHKRWNLDLAVKSPHPEIFSRTGWKESFIREAETWVDIGLHPHTVSCYYVRTLGGIPWVFAEYVEGGSLSDWIRTRRLYEGGTEKVLERVLDVAIQFAWGLQYAHEKGLIHEDVKPANVMMTPDGTAKVTDFGLAKAWRLAGEQVEAMPGGVILAGVGGMTPAYFSPEQAQKKPLSLKTDIWSWGLSVLEMFTGEATWKAGQATLEALESCLEMGAEAPVILAMPVAVAELLKQCFAHEPEGRPASMAEVATALRGIYEQTAGKPYGRPELKTAELLADQLNNRAISLLDLGREKEAEETFANALQADPHHLEATYNRGLMLWRAGRLTDDVLVQQLEEVRTALEGDRRDWRHEYLMGLVQMERSDADAAIKNLEEAAPQAPEEKDLQRALATARDGKDKWPRCPTFKGHAGQVNSVAISPDGRWGLSGSDDKTLRLWELATGECVRLFRGHTDRVRSVVISPDGRWALSGSNDNTVRLWVMATGQCVGTFEGHTSLVTSVSFSPDGIWVLSGSWDRTLRLWELATGRCVRTFEGHRRFVESVAISLDGHWGLSGSNDCTLRLWELATGRCVRTFEVHTGAGMIPDGRPLLSSQEEVNSVAFSPDSRWALSGSNLTSEEFAGYHRVRLWELATGECVRVFTGHEGEVNSIAFSPDGRWALSGSNDQTLRLWELATGECVRVFRGHRGLVLSVCFSPDGCWGLSGSRDETVRLWRLRGAGPAAAFAVTRPEKAVRVARLAVAVREATEKAGSALGRGLASEAAAEVRRARRLSGYKRDAGLVALWRDVGLRGKSIALSADWLVRTLEGHWGRVHSVAISPDVCWGLSGSEDNTLRLWELATGRCVRTFEGHTKWVKSVAISPDGQWGLSGSEDNTLRLWELATGRCVRTIERHTKSVKSVAISPDGQWGLSGSEDKTLRLWELTSGKCVRTFKGHTNAVASVSFSPDGRFGLSGSEDNTLRLWDLAKGKCVRTFKGHTDAVASVSISPDGRWGLSGSYDKAMRLWELATGRCVRIFDGHTESVCSVCFSPDGRWALSGSGDNTLRLWELATGEWVRTFMGHTSSVYSVRFSPDGRWVLSGSWDKALRLWELEWDYVFPDPKEWDEGARPHLEAFLTLHTPPLGLVHRIGLALVRRYATPEWTEEDFKKLLHTLGCAGYGWLQPGGVYKKLEEMAPNWKGPPSLPAI